jgi:hypothetical protein
VNRIGSAGGKCIYGGISIFLCTRITLCCRQITVVGWVGDALAVLRERGTSLSSLS